MSHADQRRNDWNDLSFLRRLLAVEPWLVLTLFSTLTEQQWNALLTMSAWDTLGRFVHIQIDKVLIHYPPVLMQWRQEIQADVMIRLAEGRFWKRYRPSQSHPIAYMTKCAYQYARTVCRSYWRRYGRDAA